MIDHIDKSTRQPSYCRCFEPFIMPFLPDPSLSTPLAALLSTSANRPDMPPISKNSQNGSSPDFTNSDWQSINGAPHRNRCGGAASSIKRVALLSVHTCPLALMGGKKTGGMNVYVRDFARTLAKQGIQVDIFTRSQDACQPTVKHDIGNNGRVVHIAAGPETPIPAAEVSLYIDEFVEGVCQFLTREGQTQQPPYDLLHSHYWISGLTAIKLKARWGNNIPIVHMFHTLGAMKNQVATSDAERAPQYRIDGEKEVVRHVDRIIAATPSEEEQLLRHYDTDGQKICILPPGVDLDHFKAKPKAEARAALNIPTDKQNILFAGRIEPLKGIDTLLEATWLLKERHGGSLPGLTVTIIGGDPHADTLDDEMARLQEITQELNLYDIVTFAGAKDQALLPDYYAAADVVVMPSHYESFGMVALEAMAMGKPVIASEVGGLAHLVSHGSTGFHIPPRDSETLATRLFELLMDDAYRSKLGDQAKEYAKQFDWENIVSKMQHIYVGCASEPMHTPE